LLAKERRNEARGIEKQSLSELLPNLSGGGLFKRASRKPRGARSYPGKLSRYHFEVHRTVQELRCAGALGADDLQLSALRKVQAGFARAVRVAELEESVARNRSLPQTGLAYLETMRADLSVSAAASQTLRWRKLC